MREELRKVQSSAALLERQRNPGVGYWASRQDLNGDKSPRSSIDGRDSPSRPGSPALSQSDEEINVEYLRNVILQFLEHKEMRVSTVALYRLNVLSDLLYRSLTLCASYPRF